MKIIIFLILLSFVGLYSFAQVYIQPSVGYNFSSQPSVNQSIFVTDNQKTVYTTKFKYGEGAYLGLNLGYKFKSNLFIEVNTRKTVYSKYRESVEYPDLRSLTNYFYSGYSGTINYESSILQIAPLIGYQVQKKKLTTYFKVGPNFMKSTFTPTYSYIDRVPTDAGFVDYNTVRKGEYTGKFNLGLQANLGFCYSLKQNLQLVLDFVTVYNNYKITKAKIASYEVDGVNELEKLGDTNITLDKDNNQLNHSQYGVNVGIKYFFLKKK